MTDLGIHRGIEKMKEEERRSSGAEEERKQQDMMEEEEKKLLEERIQRVETRLQFIEGNQEQTGKMLTEFLTGIKENLTPKIDTMDSSITRIDKYLGEDLKKELIASFERQGQAIKEYIDRKAGGVSGPASPIPEGQHIQPMNNNSGFNFDKILDRVFKEIDNAGGIVNILKGQSSFGGINTTNIDQDLANLLRVKSNQDKLKFRDYLLNEITNSPGMTLAGGNVTLEHR
jgi:hypothetical protein